MGRTRCTRFRTGRATDPIEPPAPTGVHGRARPGCDTGRGAPEANDPRKRSEGLNESATSGGVGGMTVESAFAGMRSVTPVVFRAGCPDCRERFELAAGALRLAIGATSRTTFYSFTCPECGASVRKPAGERIVELLTGGGVRTLRLHSTV